MSSARSERATAGVLTAVVARWRHLVGRFVGALTARVDPGGWAVLDRYLTASEQALFRTMTVADQRHSLDLCRRLHADGHDDPDLLAAALLHDVGKAAGPLSVPHRVAWTLGAMTSRTLAGWLARPPGPRWRRPFFVAAHHAQLGAAAAERAGSNPTVVRLIAGHDDPGSDRLSQTLYHYDRTM
jgi:hypothetical protein